MIKTKMKKGRPASQVKGAKEECEPPTPVTVVYAMPASNSRNRSIGRSDLDDPARAEFIDAILQRRRLMYEAQRN